MLKKYLTGGFQALIHGNRGKASQKRIPREVSVKIIELYKTRYFQFNITHFTEKLAENHNTYLCKDTVRSIINSLKLTQKKVKKKIYKRRERKANFGEMVQMDGSLHKWFGNDYSKLMAIIDDCTGVVVLRSYVVESALNVVSKLLKITSINMAFPIHFILTAVKFLE